MNQRTIGALRALAERPGTPQEGALAREMLDRFESRFPPLEGEWKHFSDFLRTGDLSDLAKATGYKTCPCGNRHPTFLSCPKVEFHNAINAELREKFPRGTRCYYNKWAYSKNCAGTVVGYSGDWNWVRVKFDHLKTSRAVPFYSPLGFHLTSYPVDDETLIQTGMREGTERIDHVQVAVESIEE